MASISFTDYATVVPASWLNAVNAAVYTTLPLKAPLDSPIFTGHPTIEGILSTGATGTGKLVYSIAPTITGHPTIEGVTSTGATGTGNLVFDGSPTLVTPTIGVATATSVNKVIITAPTTSATLTLADGKTFTASNTLTLTGTDSSTLNIGTGGTLGTAAYTASSAYATVSQVHFVGTTSIAANRASASQALTGITSIDGSAATLTTPRAIYGNNFDGSAALAQVIAGTYGGTGVNNGASTITLAGNLSYANTFTTSGNFALTLTATATSNATLPAGTNNLGYLEVPQNSKSAAYTTVLADSGKHIYHPGADTTARTWTIDSNANVAYPIGTAITFVNDTLGGVITIAITTDTMILAGAGTTGSRTLAASGIATALKMTSTRWIISGTGLT